MNLRHSLLTSITAASCVLVSACTAGPVRLGSSGIAPEGTAHEVSARACGFQLLLIFPIATNTRYQRAYNYIVRQAGDAFITNVKVKDSWSWGLVGTSYCTEMTADAIPLRAFAGTPAAAAATAPKPMPATEPVAKPAAETAPPLAPVVSSAPAPAPAPVTAGARSRVNTGLRVQPNSQSYGTIAVPAGSVLGIQGSVTNGEGRWHYASFGGRSGWLHETEVDGAP